MNFTEKIENSIKKFAPGQFTFICCSKLDTCDVPEARNIKCCTPRAPTAVKTFSRNVASCSVTEKSGYDVL